MRVLIALLILFGLDTRQLLALGAVTACVPHYFMSGATLIALATNEIVMCENPYLARLIFRSDRFRLGLSSKPSIKSRFGERRGRRSVARQKNDRCQRPSICIWTFRYGTRFTTTADANLPRTLADSASNSLRTGMTLQLSVHPVKTRKPWRVLNTGIFQALAEFDSCQGADKLVGYSDATRIGAAHGRRPVDQDAGRDPCLRLRHQPGRAHRVSGGRGLLIGRFGDRAAWLATHRHER